MGEMVKTKSGQREILKKVQTHRTVRQEQVAGRFRVYQRDEYGKRVNVSTVVDGRAALRRVRELVMGEMAPVLLAKSERARERLNGAYQVALDSVELHFDPRRSPVYFVFQTASHCWTFYVEEIP